MSETTSGAGRSEGSLVRAIGTWALAASIVNITIGGGIFRLPADVAAALGPSAPLAYIVCAVAMGLIVLCMAEAGSRVSLTGGPYAYVELAFGPFIGFLTGVLLWMLGTTAAAAVSTVFVTNAANLIPALDTGLGRGLLLAVVFAVVATVNILGVKQGSRLNGLATVAKLLPLFVLVAVGVSAVQPANIVIQQTPSASTILGSAIVLLFAFSGIETALVPSGEVKDPARTVPRAIFIAMAGITLLYIVLQVVAQGILGPDLATSRTPLADAAGRAVGPWGRGLLLGGVVVSTFGYLSGMTLALPRALFAFARDGFLPRPLAKIHPRYHTPHLAIVLQAAIILTLALSSGFAKLAIISNVAALIVYFGCSVAAWELRRRNVRAGGTPFVVPGAAIVPILSCAVILGLLMSVTREVWIVLGIVVAVSALLFVVTRARRASAVSSET
jgi:basic amino acid/polyamine antiporter, APA family